MDLATMFSILRFPTLVRYRFTQLCRPERLWDRYGKLAQQSGFNRLYLLISFDCDTKEDAGSVLKLDSLMRDSGVNPAYAVPGSLLEKHCSTYEQLYYRGSEFLNHGYAEHARWNQKLMRYESSFFYHTLSAEEVRNDIESGHHAVERVLGYTPKGFRAPHFATYQRPPQMTFIHSILNELGYHYSSSTVPLYAFQYGPIFSRYGLPEFPLSGTYTKPLQVMDSWGYFAAPNRRYTSSDYEFEAASLARIFPAQNMVGLLNYYVDPSHAAGEPSFMRALHSWLTVAKPITFSELLNVFLGHRS
jgi:hypothetical protein